MWICPQCGQRFVKAKQNHSCGDKAISAFLDGKSTITTSLFWHFVRTYQGIGHVTIHPTKSMIAFAAKKRIAYIIRLGKNFVDIVFPFHIPYPDTLCFHKVAQVPGSQQYNHHLRMMNETDINAEVKRFMRMAYEEGLAE